jgi:hypothetical protein
MQTAALARNDNDASIRIFGKRAIAGTIGLCLLLFAAVDSSAEQKSTVDDGWRRTKFGWENIRDWNLPPEQLALHGSMPVSPAILSPVAESLLWCSHPLAVALALAVVAVGGLHIAALPLFGGYELAPGTGKSISGAGLTRPVLLQGPHRIQPVDSLLIHES